MTEDNTDNEFVPLRVSPEKSGAIVDVQVNDRIPTKARIDNDGYLRSLNTQALFDRELATVVTDLERITAPDLQYGDQFKHGWDEGDAPVVEA